MPVILNQDCPIIRSRQNSHFKSWLQTGRKGPWGDAFICEGWRFAEAALQSGLLPLAFIVAESQLVQSQRLDRLAALMPEKTPVYILADDLLASLSDTCHSQGCILLLPKHFQPALSAQQLALTSRQQRWLVLDRLQDPGNVGTLIRTAAAFAFSGVLLMTGTASPYESKALRASMGAIFRLPLTSFSTAADCAAFLKARQAHIYAAALDGTPSPRLNWQLPAALVIGNEGNGVSREFLQLADCCVRIPQVPEIESLNAASAGAILCYELCGDISFK
ncbi:MAG: RNA methyltransferase [Oscillospiraceae bacterium]|nr:RNA methyltransferase [Oscillospiraceae bacterium]MDD4368561.1 RNA methyltransferase [Oscillospiraceae bacterium]